MQSQGSFKILCVRGFQPSASVGGEETNSTASARSRASKLPATSGKSQKRRDRLFMHVSLLRVMCAWQGKPTNACSCCQGRSQHPSPDGSTCSARNKKLLVSCFAPEGTKKRVFLQGSLHRELWPHLCFTVTIAGAGIRKQRRERAVPGGTPAAERQVELRDALWEQRALCFRSWEALDPDSLIDTAFSCVQDKSLLCYAAEPHTWLCHWSRWAGGGWHETGLCCHFLA